MTVKRGKEFNAGCAKNAEITEKRRQDEQELIQRKGWEKIDRINRIFGIKTRTEVENISFSIGSGWCFVIPK
jgi:hypothetical protein